MKKTTQEFLVAVTCISSLILITGLSWGLVTDIKIDPVEVKNKPEYSIFNEYFNELNDSLFSLLAKDEVLKNNMWGENSQFIRINNSKIRQTGIVIDLSYFRN